MRRAILLLASMALAALLASGVALAATGDLDPSFDGPSSDGNGKVILEQATSTTADTGAVHPDGGLVVVGSRGVRLGQGVDGFFVARLEPDGSLDGSFGGGDGVVTNDIGANRNYEGSKDVVVRPDGKIIVAGTAGYDVALIRYNPNGTLDRSFGGGDGVVRTDPPSRTRVAALLRQPDGKLVVAGRQGHDAYATEHKFLLVRYHADGSRDRSFGGGDGIVTTSVGSSLAAAHDLVSRFDGKLVVAGVAFRSGHGTDFALVRYNPNGTVDQSFGGGDGRAYADFGSREYATALVRQNGAFVAAGEAEIGPVDSEELVQKFALARFTSDGGLDRTFGGGDGKVSTAVGSEGWSYASDLVVQNDGKLVAAGGAATGVFTSGSLDSDFALARYHPGGRLDDSFGGGDGKVLTDFGATDDARGLALQPNGNIVAAGRSADFSTDQDVLRVAVARYLAE